MKLRRQVLFSLLGASQGMAVPEQFGPQLLALANLGLRLDALSMDDLQLEKNWNYPSKAP
jgi:hypothetical protein